MTAYNADAIQAAIDRDPAIGKAEAKAIHALLRGRTRMAEPEVEVEKVHTCGGPVARQCAACEPEVEVEKVHTCGGPVFGRLTGGCPRCDELRAGAAPKQGWGRSSRYDGYATEKHSCQESNCAPICTFGDW